MILPDSTIEVAARAIYEGGALKRACHWEDLPDDSQNYWCAMARDALTAALPDLIEICAKVADAEVEKIKDAIGAARRDGAYDWANEAVSRGLAVEGVATAIRSLLTTPEDK